MPQRRFGLSCLSSYRGDVPLADWRTLRRIRTESSCPQPVPGTNSTWTSIVKLTADGFWDHAIGGWPGRLFDCPTSLWWWDGVVPWLALTTDFLTSLGVNQSWSLPVDWNNNSNAIEGIGPGGNQISSSNGHTGGGGGAYAVAVNATLSPGSVLYTIASATDTMFGDTSTLVAKMGSTAIASSSPVAGGAAASCVPTTGAFSGGDGAGATGSGGGGGGGGAAGPSGDGKAGGTNGSGSSGGGGGGANGGSSTAGSAGQGGTGPTGITGGATGATGASAAAQSGAGGGGGTSGNGGAGGSGVPIWTQTGDNATAGPGGGGGAASSSNVLVGGTGGTYGGGSGGRYSTGTASAGGQGIIVVSYTFSGAFGGAEEDGSGGVLLMENVILTATDITWTERDFARRALKENGQ